MEKKTMGQFISALRRANGLTQKQLAERLNVSDKTVSRWERDDCSPEISLIPVIADIFGVTSDELLRGERIINKATSDSVNDTSPQNAPTPQPNLSARSEREIKNILKTALTKYKMSGVICIGISLIGFLTAAVVNAFNMAYLAFGLGTAICIAAGIVLAVVSIKAYSSVNLDTDDGIDQQHLKGFKKSAASIIWLAGSVLALVIAVLLPLLSVPDAYLGLTGESWFNSAILPLSITAALCLLIRLFISGKFTSEKKTFIKFTAICAIILLATLLAQKTFTSIADSEMLFAKAVTFDNRSDFEAYMEKPVEYECTNNGISTAVMSPSDIYSYQEPEYIEEDGIIIASYVWRNEAVSMVNYERNKNGNVIFKVYEFSAVKAHNNIMDGINIAFGVLYVLELIGGVVIYKKKYQK